MNLTTQVACAFFFFFGLFFSSFIQTSWCIIDRNYQPGGLDLLNVSQDKSEESQDDEAEQIKL